MNPYAAAPPPVPTSMASPVTLDQTLAAAVSNDQLVLPAYPRTACRLNDTLASPNYSFRNIVSVVAEDQSLAAACVRLANSASAGGSGTAATSLEAAVSRIGTETLKRLAFGIGVGAQVSGPGPLQEIRALCWRRSTMSAALCQRLAGRRGVVPEEAFLAGLLHDLGATIIVAAIEKYLRTPALATPRSLHEWLQIVETHHVSAGDIVARRWKLPPQLANVIRFHHHPNACPPESRAMVELVIAADKVIAHLEMHPAPGTTPFESGLNDGELNALLSSLGAVAMEVDTLAIEAPAGPARSGRPMATSAVAQPSPTIAGLIPTNLAALLKKKSADVGYRVIGVAREALVLVGAEPLPTNSLASFEIQLPDGAPVKLWSTITANRQEGSSWQIETRPFGVSGELLASWTNLVNGARAAASKASGAPIAIAV